MAIYEFESRIRFSEVGADGNLDMTGLLNYFQDCSTFQSEDLGIGVEYLYNNGMFWVVNFWQIDVLKYPHLGDRVIIGTFPYEFKGFMGFRNFYMKDENGCYLAKGTSVWTLLDVERGMPKRPSPEQIKKYEPSEKLDMEYTSRKIAIPENMRESYEIDIRPSHLDTNKHVNNGAFVEIALSCLDEPVQIERLRVEYKAQVRLGDILVPFIGTAEDGRTVIVLKGKDKETGVVEKICCVVEV